MNTLAPETPTAQIEVAGGVDTHQDTHTAAVVDQAGRMLGHRTFPTTEAGYRQLLAWLGGFGTLQVVGVEGTGAYGAGLTRYLMAQGQAELRWTALIARHAERQASPTRSTPNRPLARP